MAPRPILFDRTALVAYPLTAKGRTVQPVPPGSTLLALPSASFFAVGRALDHSTPLDEAEARVDTLIDIVEGIDQGQRFVSDHIGDLAPLLSGSKTIRVYFQTTLKYKVFALVSGVSADKLCGDMKAKLQADKVQLPAGQLCLFAWKGGKLVRQLAGTEDVLKAIESPELAEAELYFDSIQSNCMYEEFGAAFSPTQLYECTECSDTAKGICSACVRICHIGHTVKTLKFATAGFCYCGVFGRRCRCLAEAVGEDGQEVEKQIPE
jgi:hypothetical protein